MHAGKNVLTILCNIAVDNFSIRHKNASEMDNSELYWDL